MKRVLIAEDNPVLRDIFTRSFDQRYFEVTLAVDGHDTIHVLEQNLPDLVILDINIPQISEANVMARLRSCQDTRDIRVIIITGNSLAMLDQNTGCTDLFLVKPVNIPDLVSFAHQLID